MVDNICGSCELAVEAEGDRKFLVSEVCGHRLCSACVEANAMSGEGAFRMGGMHNDKDNGSSANRSAGGGRVDGSGSCGHWGGSGGQRKNGQNARGFPCPFCKAPTTQAVWMAREELTDLRFEQESGIRTKVLAIYNRGRDKFESTPGYDDYVEKREEIIFEMLSGSDERKRELNESLGIYEIDHQEEIVENERRRLADEKRKVIEIVKKEGIFYEIVRRPLDVRQGSTWWYKQNEDPKTRPVHALQRMHPEYFTEEAPPRTGRLGSGAPQPLDASIVNYDTLQKHVSTDKNAVLRACGYFKERVGQRIHQELVGGLRVNLV